MERRSTNTKGFVHFGGDIRSGVEDGAGIGLGSASTGSTVWIQSYSDDTNANIGIRAQGAGTITIGNSSNAVSLGGALSVTGVSSLAGGVIAGVGATIKGAYSTTFAWTLAAISSGQELEITLTTSVSTNLSPGDLLGHVSLNCTNAQVGVTVQDIRFSSVGSSILTIKVGNISSTATSTLAGIGRITWLDLT